MRIDSIVSSSTVSLAQDANENRAPERREALLRAASFAASQLQSGEWQTQLDTILEVLGRAAEVSRAYFFENEGQEIFSRRAEWTTPLITSPPADAGLQGLNLEAMGLSRWAKLLRNGECLAVQIADLPAGEREALGDQAIVSIALAPIRVDDKWIGFLGFEACDKPHFWDSSDIEVLRLIANLISGVVRRSRSLLALRESDSLFRLLAENSTDKIARVRPDGSFLYVSPSVEALLGYKASHILTVHPLELLHPDDTPSVARWYESIMTSPKNEGRIVYRMRHADGRYLWFETTSHALRDEHGEVIEIHTVSRDISERKRVEEALQKTEAKYRSIFENAIEGIYQTTPEGTFLDANPSLARIFGYGSPAELKELLTDIGQQIYLDPLRRIEFIREMQEKGAVSSFETQIRRRDGQLIWVSENARAVRDEHGDLLYYEGTLEDITARKIAQEQLLHDALHDKLTSLANRALFMDRMGQAFGRLKRHPEALFCVLFLDFDRFKNVNDSLGHHAGDELLIAVAQRLKECLRPGDTVSRLGGDEFAVLLDDVVEISEAIRVSERIQLEMRRPFRVVGTEIFSSVSIGIAQANSNYQNPQDLLRDADMAMYRAKALGKARHEVFDAGMHTRAVALLQLETDLRWAIERDEFQLYYQPIVSLDSGRITGFEALIRWLHPERGLVTPNEFIPIAEETGWIVPIGRWVLEEACAQISRWQSEISTLPTLTMSVNLSSKQFSQPDLIPTIQELLQRFKLPPNCLKLEITESAIMENADSVTDRLLGLRALGVKLGIDDFGTGYSSLSYLHRFPIDTLKIDRSFIARMNDDDENREIVRTIVSLGKNLGMDVVAEGVEEFGQLSDLRDLNCHHGQGFLFAHPLTSEDAFELLSTAPIW